MLAKARRLSRTDFGTVAIGKRAVSAHFSVTVAPSSVGKAAAVISKKVARTSVARHLLKRRIMAASLPFVADGRSFIVYARAGSPALSYRALERELSELLTSLPKV